MGTRCTEMLMRRFLVSSLLNRKKKTNAWRPKHSDQRSRTDLAATSLIHGIPDFFSEKILSTLPRLIDGAAA